MENIKQNITDKEEQKQFIRGLLTLILFPVFEIPLMVIASYYFPKYNGNVFIDLCLIIVFLMYTMSALYIACVIGGNRDIFKKIFF